MSAEFNPAEDARRLKEAMRGLGTNDTVLIDIISHRDRAQRQMIVSEYSNAKYGDLLADLASETSGKYRSVLLKLMMPRAEMLAELLFEATEGVGTNESVVIDIMTQFPYEIGAAAACFELKYKKTLASVIKAETSGNYQDALIALLNTTRPAANVVDVMRAENSAEAFYKAGEGRIGTNERNFISLLASNSYEQLVLINDAYNRKYKKSMEEAIKSETNGHFRDTLLACITSSDKYFANRVKQAVEGLGTDDLSLITAFVANERPQLQRIATAYQSLFSVAMSKRVGDDVSGDYKKILMALL